MVLEHLETVGGQRRSREVRNNMIKEQLQKGRQVCYRQSGWCFYPLISSNDQCTYDPVTSADEVNEDDCAFCCVQPGDRFHAHLVKKKEWRYATGPWCFIISNLEGRENSWYCMEHIYGRLVDIRS